MMLNSQANEQDKVQSAVETFFKGFHNKDSTLIKSVVHKSFSLNSASLRNNQSTLSNFDRIPSIFISKDVNISFQAGSSDLVTTAFIN